MKKPWQALLGGVLFYSVSSLLVKATASPPVTIAFYRVFIATLVVTPFWAKDFFLWWRRSFSLPLIVATLGLTLDFVLWFYSLRFTTVAHATFIVNMAPLWVGVMSTVFLKEPMSNKGWLGIALGVSGAAVMTLQPSAIQIHVGDLMALGASFGLAIYVTMTRMSSRSMSSSSVLTYSLFFFTSMWLALAVLLLGQGFLLQRHDVPFVLALALGPQLGGNTLINYALSNLPASVVSVALLGEPVIATVASSFLFGETLSWQIALGGALICLGLYATTTAVAKG